MRAALGQTVLVDGNAVLDDGIGPSIDTTRFPGDEFQDVAYLAIGSGASFVRDAEWAAPRRSAGPWI